jgi:hypothetical protein
MKKTFIGLFAIAFIISFATISSFAQNGNKGNDVERRIKFAKGKSSATVKDSIADRNTTHSWIVGAKAGQTMTVVFTSPRKDVDFCIGFPNGGEPEDSCDKRTWTIELPDDGNYTFTVDSKRENTSYTLTVTIE